MAKCQKVKGKCGNISRFSLQGVIFSLRSYASWNFNEESNLKLMVYETQESVQH